MMKNIISILSLALVFVLTHNVIAQDLENVNVNKKNYIVLTKKVGQLKPIVLAAEEMKKADGDSYGSFHVVFCGKRIEALTDKKRMKKHIERLNNSGVKLIACGFSLDKFGVNPKKLPEGVEIVDNGIAYALKLKK